ncbi:MAG TPA: HXXEE domain-containing protein [Gemmatimonadaceae bacterium]|nr:HXXEE domain-containing protein [Gemmatimonadaceae bacterium]
MSRRTIVWLIPVLLTLHNTEEALAFRAYLPRVRAILPEPFATLEASLPYSALVVALAALSIVAFLIALAAAARPRSAGSIWVLLALEAAVGVNVLAHLASAAFVFHGYGPGLVTAVAINAPFAVYCFRHARAERWVSPAALAATVPAALFLHGPVLLGALWLAGRASR